MAQVSVDVTVEYAVTSSFDKEWPLETKINDVQGLYADSRMLISLT
jgi:hypothetical protein